VASLSFFVPGLPAPQGSKVYAVSKAGKPYGREANKGLGPWRKAVQESAEAALMATDEWERDYDGPVRLELVLIFPHVASGRHWKTSPPDLDKLIRGVGDALTKARVYKDDARVVSLLSEKVHGLRIGALIQLRTIGTIQNIERHAA
jgi:crossover junction endodeoxyribonuclease RusA